MIRSKWYTGWSKVNDINWTVSSQPGWIVFSRFFKGFQGFSRGFMGFQVFSSVFSRFFKAFLGFSRFFRVFRVFSFFQVFSSFFKFFNFYFNFFKVFSMYFKVFSRWLCRHVCQKISSHIKLADGRVLRMQTWKRGPPSAWVEIFAVLFVLGPFIFDVGQ